MIGFVGFIKFDGPLKSAEPKMAHHQKIIHSDPDILGGTPVFVGTRVPVQNLIDCLEAGDSLDEFLISFPTVTRAQAVSALEIAREALDSIAHSH
jgi:uncharacterized protein (DUF433 family)